MADSCGWAIGEDDDRQGGGLAGDAGPDGAEDAGGHGAAARIRHRPAHRADERRAPLPELRHPVPGAPEAGAGGRDHLGVGRLREQPQGEVLPADPGRPAPGRAGDPRVGAGHGDPGPLPRRRGNGREGAAGVAERLRGYLAERAARARAGRGDRKPPPDARGRQPARAASPPRRRAARRCSSSVASRPPRRPGAIRPASRSVEQSLQDLRFAARQFAKAAFTATAVLGDVPGHGRQHRDLCLRGRGPGPAASVSRSRVSGERAGERGDARPAHAPVVPRLSRLETAHPRPGLARRDDGRGLPAQHPGGRRARCPAGASAPASFAPWASRPRSDAISSRRRRPGPGGDGDPEPRGLGAAIRARPGRDRADGAPRRRAPHHRGRAAEGVPLRAAGPGRDVDVDARYRQLRPAPELPQPARRRPARGRRDHRRGGRSP